MKPKLAIVISHVIQHFIPQYESLSKNKNFDLKVFFMSTKGLKPYKDKDFKQSIQWNNINLDLFDHYFEHQDPINIGKNVKAAGLLNEIANYNPDVVIGYGYAQKFQRQIKNWSKNETKKYYYISDSELNHSELKLKTFLKYFFIKKYFKNIDRFLSVGSANEFYYQKHGVQLNKITRMNFPIDRNSYDSFFESKTNHNINIRQDFQISMDDFVISMVGKFVNWKNQDDLIKALLLIDNKTNKKITCLLIGTGPDEEKLKLLSKKLKYHEVIFTGFVSPEKLPEYYAATDLYVHTAKKEPHSLAISESIYMATPCLISSKTGSYGPNDDVTNGSSGNVFEFGDIEELGKNLIELSSNMKTIKKWSNNAREYSRLAQENAHRLAIESALHADDILA